MEKLELPIGDASFHNLRTSNCYYVDKTPHLWNLTKGGSRYWFLSRPRRFGKSLLVDTLHELFAGSEELFQGLYIQERWDWKVKYPVVRLSFDGKYSAPGELEKDIMRQLRGPGYPVPPPNQPSPSARLLRLPLKGGVMVVPAAWLVRLCLKGDMGRYSYLVGFFPVVADADVYD